MIKYFIQHPDYHYSVVRFEDLALHPADTFRTLMESLNLTVTSKAEDYIQSHTLQDKNNKAVSHDRDARHTVKQCFSTGVPRHTGVP